MGRPGRPRRTAGRPGSFTDAQSAVPSVRSMKVMSAVQQRLYESFTQELIVISEIVRDFMGDIPYPFRLKKREEGASRKADYDDKVDVVVFSAREIPGNEKAIGRVMNHIAKRGADIVYEGIKHVHVSGHGSEEELKMMLSLVRPRYFVPIHGEYRQLARLRDIFPNVSLHAFTATATARVRRRPSARFARSR